MSQFIRDLIALLAECCLSRLRIAPIDDHEKDISRVVFADVESSRIKGMR